MALVVGAALSVVSLQAQAQTQGQTQGQAQAQGGAQGQLAVRPAQAQKSANITFSISARSAGRGNTTYTIRVLNNGPDDLVADDFQVVLAWEVGHVVSHSGDTACIDITDHHCILAGQDVQFFEGPVIGPGFYDVRVTLGGTTNGFFIDVVNTATFAELLDVTPDFGLQPPVQCLNNNCSQVLQ